MRHLLDTNLLISAILVEHPFHRRALAWLEGKDLAVCPIVETGFLRITTGIKIGSPMARARSSLDKFLSERKVQFIPDDLRALESPGPGSSAQITDHYLADLARKHGFKLATMDQGIKHPAVELIPKSLEKAG